MLNPLLNILSQVQTPQGAAAVQGGAQGLGIPGLTGGAQAGSGSFVNLLGNVVSVVESAQVAGATDASALAQMNLLQAATTTEKLSEDTIAALYGAATATATTEFAPVAPVATGDVVQVNVDGGAVAQAAIDTAAQNDVLLTSALNNQLTQEKTNEASLSAEQVQANALADLHVESQQQKQQLRDPSGIFKSVADAQAALTSAASVSTVTAADESDAKSLLEKAFKLFNNTNNSATHHEADKSTVVRAAQAYSDANSDQSAYTPFKNDGTFGAVAVQAQANDNATTATQIAAPATVGKVGEVSSEAAVAVKNPVPNFPSHNPTAAEQVSMRISHALKTGESELSIKLEPAELGKVEVRLNLPHSDGKAIVSIIADEARTLEMLKTDSRSLERALNDAGIKTDAGSLSFNLRGDNSNQMARNDNNGFGYNNSPAARSGDITTGSNTSSGGGISYVSDQALDIMV